MGPPTPITGVSCPVTDERCIPNYSEFFFSFCSAWWKLKGVYERERGARKGGIMKANFWDR